MRVSFLLNSLQTGGAEIHTVELAERLQDRGHDCQLVSLLSRTELSVPATLDHHVVKGNGLTDIRAMRRLVERISASRADVVVAVNVRPLIYAHLARALGLKLPIVCIFHTTDVRDLRLRANIALARPFFARSDLLIYVSANQRRHWEDRSLTAKRVATITNGIDVQRFSPRSAAQHRLNRRHELGYVETDYVIGMSAAFRPEKNHVQAIEAVAALRAKGAPAKLLLLGDGPTLEPVRARAKALGILDVVHFAGRRDDVAPWVAAFDVGLLTSTAIETFSLSALEVMAMGVPMVMSDIGGASEMLEDGVNGRLFPSGDTDVLVGALRELSDPARRLAAGRAAANVVRTRFAHGGMVERYDALLRELARTPLRT